MTDLSEQQFLAPQAATLVLRDDERQRCEVWTRVMGYHRPMASFNTGKKGEFHERTYFSERNCHSK
ncbi:MAG: anaerobic ribonucleoside-triphosphate reductase [Rhodoferax sp.]|nr:anaerobic ribonucleoside-triphosphate reductase [Rhodoferax sp.]MDP3651865.1 anaerobic ribonucleoside-triphosphate reductase [Rhodoferax sp.]